MLHKEELFDLMAFILILVVVLFLLYQGYGQSNLNIFPMTQKKITCSQYDGQFDECANAQRSRAGCVWYASCSRCAKDGTKLDEVCEQL